MGVGPLLLSEGPCSLDAPESCPHLLAGGRFIQGLGRNGPPALAEVRAGLAGVQRDPEKSKHVMVPGILRAGRQGTEGRSLGCAQAAPETCWGTAGNLCSILCVPEIMTTLSAPLGKYKFGDCTVVSGLLVLDPKGKNGGPLL